MLYKHKIKFIPVLAMVALIAATLSINVSKAATVVVLSDTMSNQTISALSSHNMVFQVPSGVAAAGTIVITFPSGFDTTTLAFGTMTAAQGATSSLGTSMTLGASASGATWGVAVTTTTVTLTSGTGTVTAGNYVGITMSTPAAPLITNPGTTGSKLITIAAGVDTGSLAVPILTDGLVTITATVDPTITLTLSSNTCALGTLASGVNQTCQYNVTVSTNATGGYTGYIRDDGNLRNATDDINDVTGGAVAAGTEAYGVATSDSTSNAILTAQGGSALTSGACTSADGVGGSVAAAPLTATNQTFTVAAAPVSGDITYLCHSASITAITPAGSFASISTITVAGNF